MPNNFVVKDSWYRQEYPSWMVRDTQDWKPRYDLIERSMLKRFAIHLGKWAMKYWEHNWKKANSMEEVERFYWSGMRHLMQSAEWEVDEDHAAAVMFNVMAMEYVKEKVWSQIYTPQSVSDSVNSQIYSVLRGNGQE